MGLKHAARRPNAALKDIICGPWLLTCLHQKFTNKCCKMNSHNLVTSALVSDNEYTDQANEMTIL